ncbi:winged helix-turn-helix domain-containing protein [Microbacterium sediminicola]|uniref:Winged helix-turn-helix domain-containing protein n=1 Tax=Microbacterium sediminicola TaxID=415210 RepID=A0ABN2HWN3_9MICO
MTHHLSRDEARRIAVRAQLLDAQRPGDVVEVAEQLGWIKIDPTAAITTSEHAILWARIGWGYEPGQLQKAVEVDRQLFEFDGTLRPMSVLGPLLTVSRHRRLYADTGTWLAANERFGRDVISRLRAEGPMPASAIPDTSQVQRSSESGWYGANQVPRMLEVLSRLGEVAVVGRQGRLRVWDVVERAYPDGVPDLPLDEAERLLAERRLQGLGIAKKSAMSPVGTAGEPVTIEGLPGTYRVDSEALAALDEDEGGRVAILNPYDVSLYDRRRLRDLFGFEYKVEQFVPKAQRVYGYFAHPVLVGDRFMGLLDAEHDRKREVLRVNALHELEQFEPEELEMVHAEIRDLGGWLGVPVVGLGD